MQHFSHLDMVLSLAIVIWAKFLSVGGKIDRIDIFLSTLKVWFSLFSGKTFEAKTTRLLFHHLETITSLGTDETTRVNTLLVRNTIFVVIIMKYSKKLCKLISFGCQSQLQNETCDRKHRRGIKSKVSPAWWDIISIVEWHSWSLITFSF